MQREHSAGIRFSRARGQLLVLILVIAQHFEGKMGSASQQFALLRGNIENILTYTVFLSAGIENGLRSSIVLGTNEAQELVATISTV